VVEGTRLGGAGGGGLGCVTKERGGTKAKQIQSKTGIGSLMRIKCWQGSRSTNARDDFLRFRGLTGAAAVESPATETAASASPEWAAVAVATSSLRSSKSDMADV